MRVVLFKITNVNVVLSYNIINTNKINNVIFTNLCEYIKIKDC